MIALQAQECRIGSSVGVVPLFKRLPREQAFTLVELLVAIAIISLLVVITVPMVRQGQEAAIRARVMTEINTIVRAVEAYHREYGRYPRGGNLGSEGAYLNGNGALIDVLRAANTGDSRVLNPRRYPFLDVADNSLSGDRGSTNRDFIDPWGAPYRIMMDVNRNGEIPVGDPFNEIVRRSVVAWSMGDTERYPNRALKSW